MQILSFTNGERTICLAIDHTHDGEINIISCKNLQLFYRKRDFEVYRAQKGLVVTLCTDFYVLSIKALASRYVILFGHD